MKRRNFLKSLFCATALLYAPSVLLKEEDENVAVIFYPDLPEGGSWLSQQVTITGIDQNGNRVVETLELRGTEPVETDTVWASLG